MFVDSLLEVSWAQRSRRSLSTLTSFAIEAVVLALIVLLSLLRSMEMPSVLRTVSTPIAAGRPEPRPLASRPHSASAPVRSNTIVLRLMQPGSIPNTIDRSPDDPNAQPPSDPYDGIPGAGFPSNGPGLPVAIGGTRPVMPVAPVPQPTRVVRSSNLLEGMLIRKVQPVYPPLARNTRIQGPVVLEALINKAGAIQNLHLISGHPMLVPAAIEAVSQWRYRPYILNGEAIEVETQITVNFILSGN